MPSPQPAEPGSSSRTAGRYRWVTVWLAIGCAVALLLLANAVRDYRFVSRVLATQQVRHQIAQISTAVEQQLRRSDQQPLRSALQDTLHGNESVDLRNPDGSLLEHLGVPSPSLPFTPQEERTAFAQRQPLFRTIATPTGEVVVEVFAIRSPRRPDLRQPGARPPDSRPPEPSAPPSRENFGPRPMILAVAIPLREADTSVLTSIRRNLAINLAAALALFATVLLAAVGLRSYVKGRRLEEQMEIARQVQSRLLPSPVVPLPGLQIATVYQPAEQVGGDFYDLFAGNPNRLAAVIGDVSGKGLPAALLMGVIHGAVRSAPWHQPDADQQAESTRLNRLLCERASGNRFASMFWCVYDSHLRSLRYVNAGHCPPLLLSHATGSLTTRRLCEGGPVLGLLPDAAYTAANVEIGPGDLLIMYSDGLVEAIDVQGEQYGEDRLIAFLDNHFDQTPDAIRDAIMSSWTAFSPSRDTQDDLTLAIIRF